MTTETFVWITTSFIGYHCWRGAPEQVKFLRDFHRHVFHVKVMVKVAHDDRDIEFIMLKQRVDDYLRERYHEQWFKLSCEMIAHDLLVRFNAVKISVSEDGENGATVRKV